MHHMNRIVGIGVMSLFLALFSACAGVLQPTACSAGAAEAEWIGVDIWVRADLDRVQRELACGAEVNATNEYGNTPLHYAAYRNEHAAVIEALLEAGAAIHAKNNDGKTILHFAAGNNESVAVIEALLEAGADVNDRDAGGWTPLHWAAEDNESAAVIEALLEAGADVNAKNDDGNTPLDWAEIAANETPIGLLQRER